MDKTHRKNILLGFFVLIGIAIFITGIFLIGSKNELFNKTVIITANFSNATGLKPGSNVRFNGVKVGIVKAVTLMNDSVVKVDMVIEESKRVYILKTAIAAIGSDGLMGDKIVNITSGKETAAVIDNNDVIKAKNPIVTDQVMQTLNMTNENVKVISDNLRQLTTSLNSEDGTIQALYKDPKMAVNLKQSFANLNAITKKVLDVSNTLQRITAQIQKGNGTIGEILNDTTMGQNLAYTMEKLKETSDQLILVSGEFTTTMQRVNSGTGTVNMLLTDTVFAGTIQQSMLNIKSASLKLDENMEALKHNVLTRGYFKKQAKKEMKMQKATK